MGTRYCLVCNKPFPCREDWPDDTVCSKECSQLCALLGLEEKGTTMTARMPAVTATQPVHPKNEPQGTSVALDPILADLDDREVSEWMLDRPNATAAEFEARFGCDPPDGWFPGVATADEWL